MAEGYRGLVGAYVFAFRQSRSWLFRSYVLTSAAVGLFIALLLVLAVISWSASPVAFGQRAFLGVIGLLVIIPLAAPVLIVARRYRVSGSSTVADRWLGIAGYGFVASIVIALYIGDPASHAAGGAFRPLVVWLDGLPGSYGLVPPAVGAGAIAVVARLTRPMLS